VTKDRTPAISREVRPKNMQQSSTLAIYKWRPHLAPTTHLERLTERAQIASIPDGLEATRKRQSWHKLMSANWKITSLTGKEHEQLEEAKRNSLDVVYISSTEVV